MTGMFSLFPFIVTSLVLVLSSSVKSLALQKASNDSCPPDDDIYPCYCYVDSTDAAFLSCERLHDVEKAKEVLSKTKDFNLYIIFSDSRLGDVPSDFFEGQKASSVHFENCKIGSFGDRPFSGLEDTLEAISIYGSVNKRTKDLKTLPLAHLKKLKYFSFQANDIKKLGNEWFDGGPSTIEQLSLEANDIEELGDKAFASLVNLEQVWLGDNSFGVVLRSMFPMPAQKLKILEMGFNGIESLPKDLFSGMPSLTTVNVAGNKLPTLDPNVWKVVWGQLDEVYVDRNGLVCDKDLKWIYADYAELPKILDGKCGGYNDHRGKELEKLTINDFE